MKQEKRVKQKRYVIRNLLIFAGVLIIVVGGIFLPDTIFAVQEQNEYNQVGVVDEKYLASSSSLARTVSSNLSIYERLQLVSGEWEGEWQTAEDYEMEQQDYEVIALARESIKELYDAGLYPVDLSSEYANWYTWTISPYKLVDTTFHTYTAYCWEINFEKYDKSEVHTIYMIEDGTIYMAKAAGMANATVTAKDPVLHEKAETVTSLNIYSYDVKELLPYEENTAIYTNDSLTWITKNTKSYLLFQFYGNYAYMYALTPSL